MYHVSKRALIWKQQVHICMRYLWRHPGTKDLLGAVSMARVVWKRMGAPCACPKHTCVAHLFNKQMTNICKP